MTDFARLVMSADTRGLVSGVQALDKVTAAGARAEATTDAVSAGFDRASGSAKKTGLSLVDVAMSARDMGSDFGAQATNVQASMSAMAAASMDVRTALGAQATEVAETAMETAAYGRELDRIRAKFNPLFAASKQYEHALEEIAEAERMGAISAIEATQARERAAGGMIRVGNAAETVTRRTGAMSGGFRNLGLQLNQVAQVGGMTGNWMQALAIQLPDMLLGFGSVGIAAGIAAGAMIPFVSNLFEGADGSKELADALDDLDGAQRAYNDVAEIGRTSVRDLTEEYGKNAEAVKELYQELTKVAQQQALNALDAVIASASDNVSDITQVVNRLSEARRELGRAMASQEEGAPIPKAEMDAYKRAVQDVLDELQEDFGLTSAGAYRIKDAFDALASAGTPEAAAQAAKQLSTALASAYDGSTKMPPELAEIAMLAGQAFATFARIEATTADAVGQTEAWAGAMASVNAEIQAIMSSLASIGGGLVSNAAKSAEIDALRAGKTIRQAAVERDRFEREAEFTAREQSGNWFQRIIVKGERAVAEYGVTLDEVLDKEREIARGREKGASKTGGGGANEDLRAAERIYQETRTAMERYNAELAEINRLHEAGYLTTETYTRALDQIDEKYEDAIAASSDFAEVNALLKDSILEFAMGGENAMDSLAQAIKRAALEALLFGEGPLGKVFGNIGGGKGLLGKLFSFDGGGYTGDGARSGGIDGKGGFLAMMHPNETVIDHTKGQSGGAVHVTFGVDGNGNLMPFVQEVSGQVAARAVGAGMAVQDRKTGQNLTNYTARKG